MSKRTADTLRRKRVDSFAPSGTFVESYDLKDCKVDPYLRNASPHRMDSDNVLPPYHPSCLNKEEKKASHKHEQRHRHSRREESFHRDERQQSPRYWDDCKSVGVSKHKHKSLGMRSSLDRKELKTSSRGDSSVSSRHAHRSRIHERSGGYPRDSPASPWDVSPNLDLKPDVKQKTKSNHSRRHRHRKLSSVSSNSSPIYPTDRRARGYTRPVREHKYPHAPPGKDHIRYSSPRSALNEGSPFGHLDYADGGSHHSQKYSRKKERSQFGDHSSRNPHTLYNEKLPLDHPHSYEQEPPSSPFGSYRKQRGYEGYGGYDGAMDPVESRYERGRQFYNDYNGTNYVAQRRPTPSYGRQPKGRSDMHELINCLERFSWNSSGVPEFRRNFYSEHPAVKAMTLEQAKEERRKRAIRILYPSEEEAPNPVLTFEQAAFPNNITALLDVLFRVPTPIQSQCWPTILAGNDLVGIAETGCGKTLAFVLPSLVHIQAQPPLRPNDGPIVLILAPTRELIDQIGEEANRFASLANIRTATVYGQMVNSIETLRKLREGVHLLAASPAKLMDLCGRRQTNLSRVTFFVLDEADRLLDQGFQPQILSISNIVRPDRQVLMLSATWNTEVDDLMRRVFPSRNRPHHVQIGAGPKAVSSITQTFHLANSESEKQQLFFDLMDDTAHKLTLVFANTKRTVDYLYRQLPARTNCHVFPGMIHGDIPQTERRMVLKKFKEKQLNCLIATDLASRGLDILNILQVVNYDCPRDYCTYIHRVGRTGRVGRKGTSVTFLTREDVWQCPEFFRGVIPGLIDNKQQVPSWLKTLVESAGGYGNRLSSFYDEPERTHTRPPACADPTSWTSRTPRSSCGSYPQKNGLNRRYTSIAYDFVEDIDRKGAVAEKREGDGNTLKECDPTDPDDWRNYKLHSDSEDGTPEIKHSHKEKKPETSAKPNAHCITDAESRDLLTKRDKDGRYNSESPTRSCELQETPEADNDSSRGTHKNRANSTDSILRYKISTDST